MGHLELRAIFRKRVPLMGAPPRKPKTVSFGFPSIWLATFEIRLATFLTSSREAAGGSFNCPFYTVVRGGINNKAIVLKLWYSPP